MSEASTNPEITININQLLNIFKDLSSNQDKLINGYKIISAYEKSKGFYTGILEIIFSNQTNKILTKLCCSTFIVFVNKNWIISEYIEHSERLVN